MITLHMNYATTKTFSKEKVRILEKSFLLSLFTIHRSVKNARSQTEKKLLFDIKSL